jgi:hypothetical protein
MSMISASLEPSISFSNLDGWSNWISFLIWCRNGGRNWSCSRLSASFYVFRFVSTGRIGWCMGLLETYILFKLVD